MPHTFLLFFEFIHRSCIAKFIYWCVPPIYRFYTFPTLSALIGVFITFHIQTLVHLCRCVVNFFVINTLRPRQNGRHLADDSFKWIFLNEDVWIPIKISLNFVPQGPVNNIPALVQIMAWRRPRDKPLSGPMMVRLPTHICVTRPQRVNKIVWRHHSKQFSNIFKYILVYCV